MFNEKLQKFLYHNDASRELFSRLNSANVVTLEDAWNKASDEDLIWVVTRPGVMNPDQRRLFLIMILSSIENKLTDPCSKNILTKLRANETITEEDRAAADASRASGDASGDAAWAAARAAAGDASGAAAWAAARAAADASRAAWAAARAAAWAAAWAAAGDASGAAAWAAARAAADASRAAWAAARAAAGAAQAKWVRENFNLCDLRTN